ncbi:MAG TPA: hypothetical protein VFW83_07330 [Bryobacteraceae bacterium]|nr:hypothetical protein [Bryobacteraceae bacterium]
MPGNELIATLRALHDGGVEFILVGGLAAALNGAAAQDLGLDLVYALDAANIARLLPVLEFLAQFSEFNRIGS